MYKITVDRPKALIEVELGGMMTPHEAEEYISELRRNFVLNNLRTYGMVIDVTNCPIQGQDVTRAMGEHMAKMPKARALAVVTGS